MEYRLGISKKEQIIFLKLIKNSSGLNSEDIGKLCHVSGRTFRDWARAKFTIPLKIGQYLSKKFKVNFPKKFKVLNEFWQISKIAKMGALARYKLYGPPGSIESRRKGGTVSQQNRKDNPKKYKMLGCNIKKIFKFPKYSEELAELAGIIMGDGSINNYQLRIYLDRKVDKKYTVFVGSLIKRIFHEQPSLIERKNRGTIEITLSGIGLVEILKKIGLKKGDKAINKIKFPKWIWQRKSYQTACIRGLFDTDGGLYFHIHKKWKNKKPYLGWCFSSSSKNLINDYLRALSNLGLNAKKAKEDRIYIYNFSDIEKYMNLVDTSNIKNAEKFNKYLKIKK